jgi:DNA-binding winged helix-turn-helix (wHTH) protein
VNQWVWCDEQHFTLTPIAFAVLRYLVEHPGRLVTKQELMQAAWPHTTVSAWALTTCMRRLRQVLGDVPQAPQFIETVHRRGYRLIASAMVAEPHGPTLRTQVPQPTGAAMAPLPSSPGRSPALLVGRDG